MRRLYSAIMAFISVLFGRNLKSTPADVIIQQMNEPRPLPMGKTEFEQWAERIVAGALVEGVPFEDQAFALSNMILHLGPTESHKPDAFFIHQLRKVAVNQVADAMRSEYREISKARIAAKEAEESKAKEEANV